jgi:beta-galactosidase
MPKGHEVAWEQFQIKKQQFIVKPELAIYRTVSLEETQDAVVVKGDGFQYAFSKENGQLNQMQANGVDLLEAGPLFNVWRAPIANDIDPWNNWQHRTQEKVDGLGRSRDNHWRTMGIELLEYELDNMEFFQPDETSVVIKVGETAYTSTKEGGFSNTYTYRVKASGELSIDVETIARGKMPHWLPRVGLQFQLPQEFQGVSWDGRGPQENYPDRKTGYKVGNYSSTVEEMYVPYLIPQDYGNRSDVSMVKMTNDDGVGLSIEGDNFNFSAQNYDTDHLTRAMYPFQLKKADKVFLNIDHKVNGLGDTSLATLQEHRVKPGTYAFSFVIMPVE